MSNPAVADYNEHAQFGVSYSRTFTHLEDDGTTPIPSTGKTGAMIVRQYDGGPTLITMSVAIGGANGAYTPSATATQMRAIESAADAEWVGVYDLVVLDSGVPQFVLAQGEFHIHPTVSVTQP